jgi:predicted PurR-regulated permease PerM
VRLARELMAVTSATAAEERPPPRSVARIVGIGVAVVVSAVFALYLIYLLRTPLSWIFVAGFIAVAVSGPVNVLSRRMKRGLAIAIVYIGLIFAPIGLLGLLVPPIVEQVNNLIDNAPRYAQDITEYVQENETLRGLNEDYDLTGRLQEEAAKLPQRAGAAAGVLGDIGLGIVNGIFTAVTILTLAIFMTGGGPRWRDAFLRSQPAHRGQALRRMFEAIGYSTGNYVRGALLQATIAGVTAFIMLRILGIPFAAALAVVVFALDLIPLIGATLGAVIVGIVILFAGDMPLDLIVWVVFSVVYQQLENNVIQPRIQSKAVALEPFLVVVSVLFGATLFGIMGALLSVPVAAAIQIAAREYNRFRKGRFDDAGDNPRGDDRSDGEPPTAPPGDPAPAPA